MSLRDKAKATKLKSGLFYNSKTTAVSPEFTSGFDRFQKIAGHLVFMIILIYSIVYAVERTVYIDSAWLFFDRVNGEKFSFPGDRFSAFFSEVPLYVASKFHFSLKTLVYVFSISYVLLFYLVWRLVTYTLGNPAAGLTILFGMLIGVREVFLYSVSETHQAFVYSALLFAVMQHNFGRHSFLKNTCAAFTALLVLFAHPLGVFTSGFVVAYQMISHKSIRNFSDWFVAAIIATFALWNFLHPANPYDAAQFSQIKNAGAGVSVTNSAALNFITMHFTHFYWLPELAGLIVAVWLLLKKEWLKLALVTVSVAAYLGIAFVTFRNGDSSIMLERIFLPAFFMINLVFAGLLASETRLNKWIPMLLVVFFVVNGIRYINTGCLMYKKRVAYLDELVKAGIEQGNDQYFLSDARLDKEKLLVPWALGSETLIYSKLKYNRFISITLKDETCPKGNCRLNSMLCLPVTELNPHYFQLSGNEYTELK